MAVLVGGWFLSVGFGWLVPCPVPGGLLSSCGWLNQGFDVQDSSERAVPADGPTGTPDVRLWGKHRELPGPYPVVCHLLDTAAMAGALFDEWFGAAAAGRLASSLGVEPGAVRAMVMFWAGLHDIGKVTPPFQAKVPDLYKALIGDPDYATVSLTENERGSATTRRRCGCWPRCCRSWVMLRAARVWGMWSRSCSVLITAGCTGRLIMMI
ncbi:HD domain-containing protein [Catenulispora yoronensis]